MSNLHFNSKTCVTNWFTFFLGNLVSPYFLQVLRIFAIFTALTTMVSQIFQTADRFSLHLGLFTLVCIQVNCPEVELCYC